MDCERVAVDEVEIVEVENVGVEFFAVVDVVVDDVVVGDDSKRVVSIELVVQHLGVLEQQRQLSVAHQTRSDCAYVDAEVEWCPEQPSRHLRHC